MALIGDPVVGMSISNRLVLPTSVGDFNMIESNFSCTRVESLS